MKGVHHFKQSQEAVSPVIGVILMVAITVIMAAVVFVLVGNLTEVSEQPPEVQFTKTGDQLVVQKADKGLDWGNFTVSGCTSLSGSIDAGDRLIDCSGLVTITHNPSNTLIYQGDFT